MKKTGPILFISMKKSHYKERLYMYRATGFCTKPQMVLNPKEILLTLHSGSASVTPCIFTHLAGSKTAWE